MVKIERIHRQLSGKHVVWFHESNQWVAFEQPAYIVFNSISSGEDLIKVSEKIALQFKLTKKEAEQFVSEINDELIKITSKRQENSNNRANEFKKSPDQVLAKEADSTAYKYIINGSCVEVEYSHDKLAYYLHSPIKHLETNFKEPACKKLKLSVGDNTFSLYRDNSKIASYNTISELKHAFINQLMYATYSIDIEEWFAWIHGSAVTDGKKALIFTSSSGSGKSTLAAILQTRGYTVLSDDMIFMRGIDKLAYPVPVALSIKKGALKTILKYIPAFTPQELQEYKFGERKIHFMPPEIGNNDFFKAMPVSCVVFINYKSDSPFSFKQISDYNAFCKFHKEAWINGSQESALSFINWFQKLAYYNLEFSDTDKAIEAVEELFKN